VARRGSRSPGGRLSSLDPATGALQHEQSLRRRTAWTRESLTDRLARARLETREIVQVERLVASWLIGRARS